MKSEVAPKQIKSLTIALIVVAMLLSGVQLLIRGAETVTNDVLNDNWRGAFDILVTHKDFEQQVSPGKNEFDLAFLDPNYGGVAAPTLSQEQVTAVAEITGVEFAAPLAYLGTQVKTQKPYHVVVPWSEFDKGKVQSFRFTMVPRVSDGFSERVLGNHINTFTINIENWNGKYGFREAFGGEVSGVKVIWENTGGEPGWYLHPEGIGLLFFFVPQPVTSVAAINPVAEMQLLKSDGDFLQPLQEAEEIFAEHGAVSAATYADWSVANIAAANRLKEFPAVKQLQELAELGFYGDGDFFPYISTSKAPTPIFVVTKFERKVGDVYVSLGESETNLSALYMPFGVYNLHIPFPGSKISLDDYQGQVGIHKFESLKIGSLALKPRLDENGNPAFEVMPLQIGNALVQLPEYEPDGRGIGDIRDYRPIEENQLKLGKALSSITPFNVGSYEPVTKSMTDVYTPLGLYEKNFISTVDGKVLETSLTGAGLALDSATAIVSINTAKKLVDDDFITSVRVKVAGLEDLPREQAQLEIDKVAQQIRALGLSAKVVYGASQQEVLFWVPGYSFGTMDVKGTQEIGDLGWVTQAFTVLGADEWTETTTTMVITAAGVILLILVILALVVIMLLVRPGRVRGQNLLKTLGYGLGFRVVWAIKESSAGLICLAIGVIASIALSTENTVLQTLIISSIVVVAVFLAIPFARARSQRLPSKFGSRSTLFGIAALESIIATVCVVIIFGLAQLGVWFWQTGSKLSLSRLVLESLLPLLLMVLVVLAFLIYLQFIAAKFSHGLLKARIIFAYEILAQSQSRIMLRLVLVLVGMLLFIGLLLGAAAIYGSQWIEFEDIAFLTAGVWLGVWVIMRLLTLLQIRPAKLANRI